MLRRAFAAIYLKDMSYAEFTRYLEPVKRLLKLKKELESWKFNPVYRIASCPPEIRKFDFFIYLQKNDKRTRIIPGDDRRPDLIFFHKYWQQIIYFFVSYYTSRPPNSRSLSHASLEDNAQRQKYWPKDILKMLNKKIHSIEQLSLQWWTLMILQDRPRLSFICSDTNSRQTRGSGTNPGYRLWIRLWNLSALPRRPGMYPRQSVWIFHGQPKNMLIKHLHGLLRSKGLYCIRADDTIMDVNPTIFTNFSEQFFRRWLHNTDSTRSRVSARYNPIRSLNLQRGNAHSGYASKICYAIISASDGRGKASVVDITKWFHESLYHDRVAKNDPLNPCILIAK